MTDDGSSMVSTPDQMTLKPSARLQRFLGRELIADPNLAVLEFVKNAYDAGATKVVVNFALAQAPSVLRIADNGIGMDETSFRFNWLRPGFSKKSSEYLGDGPETAARGIQRDLVERREPAGEKGLGRLAAGRLGERLTIWTREDNSSKWLKVEFDWARFDDMYKSIDQINIPFSYEEDAPDGAFESGTLLEITGLTQNWGGRIAGRPAAGRSRTRLGRLKQDLSFLLRANSNPATSFEIDLESDVVASVNDIGVIRPDTSKTDSADYVYKFSMRQEGDSEGPLTVTRTLIRSDDTANRTGKPRTEVLAASEELIDSTAPWPGPVSGLFTYTPPPAAKRAQEIDLATSGVLLYRDDVLVEPYGMPGNDWLGVAARKASRQGHAAIQPSTFSGEVNISRTANPELVDMSNRLGLLENEVSGNFIELMRSEFRIFESLLYEEVLVEGNWQGSGQKKEAKQAALAEEFAQLRLKALAHRAGQPLQAMGFGVVGLQMLATNESIPSDLRSRIVSYSSALETSVERLAKIVDEIANQPVLDPSEFELGVLLERAVDDLTPFAEAAAVDLSYAGGAGGSVFAARELIFEALVEVITNAIEAVTDSANKRVVSVTVDEFEAYTDVAIRDTGTGFGSQVANLRDFRLVESTKGRPAGGLLDAYNSLLVCRGDLAVASTGDEGTVVVVRLPRGAAPVPKILAL